MASSRDSFIYYGNNIFTYKMVSVNNSFFVLIVIGPNDKLNAINHLNSEHVQFFEPHCISFKCLNACLVHTWMPLAKQTFSAYFLVHFCDPYCRIP